MGRLATKQKHKVTHGYGAGYERLWPPSRKVFAVWCLVVWCFGHYSVEDLHLCNVRNVIVCGINGCV